MKSISLNTLLSLSILSFGTTMVASVKRDPLRLDFEGASDKNSEGNDKKRRDEYRVFTRAGRTSG
jgi:hypothetical protein